ncbi:unnamed protein product [Gongylonema pulchrum]|uniref:RMI1_N domain-containing protein n=1 Tax=Gongylonema pulchrum TaxID=637853 RepID=A0A183DNG3_9BILA|nr:unnamed protein product [Gongylonema pulchrum]
MALILAGSPPQTSPVFAKSCSLFDSSASESFTSSQPKLAAASVRPPDPAFQQAASNTNKTSTDAQLGEGERTPLFGVAPAWWGESSRCNQQVQSDTESARQNALSSFNVSAVRTTSAQRSVLSDTELMRVYKLQQQQGPDTSATENVVRRPLKSIRMDIDLNEPFVDEEVKKEEKAKSGFLTSSAPRTSASTAFTVSFDNDESSPKANLSLQDAAKKTCPRRFMRRSGLAAGELVSKGAAAKIAGLTAASSDPKQYLLNKMLMGIGEDDGDRLNQIVASQTVKDSDAESVSRSQEITVVRICGILALEVRDVNCQVHDVSVVGVGFTDPTNVKLLALPQINENVSSTEDGEKGDYLLRELLHISSGRLAQRRGIAGRQVVAPSTPPLTTAARLKSSGTGSGPRARGLRRPDGFGAAAEERQRSSQRLCTLASSSRTSVMSAQVHHRTQPVAGATGTSDGTFR